MPYFETASFLARVLDDLRGDDRLYCAAVQRSFSLRDSFAFRADSSRGG